MDSPISNAQFLLRHIPLLPTPTELITLGRRQQSIMLYAIVILACAATATATINQRQNLGPVEGPRAIQHVNSICSPMLPNGAIDLNAPCNQAHAITQECLHGAPGLAVVEAPQSDDSTSVSSDNSDGPIFSNITQRDCICESRYFAAEAECGLCQIAHGIYGSQSVNVTAVTAFHAALSTSYCAVTNTPTLGFAEVLFQSVQNALSQATTTISNPTSLYTDPLGNNTAVSAYYTPSVTGSAAWLVAQGTQTPSNATLTSGMTSSSSGAIVMTSNGQIVATASAASGTSSAPASGTASAASASSSTAGSGAGRQEVVAVAGVIALAGLVVVL
jgi:hypothetical protein